MVIHSLKLSADYYDDSASGIKTFEIRENDRNYKVGDILELREWIWSGLDGQGAYTGNVHRKIITYILEDEAFLAKGYVCLAVAPIAEPWED
jgi:ParB family chromosome partitioning protein